MFRHKILFISTYILLAVHGLNAQCPQLKWADEFDGTTLNEANWSYEIGDGCDINLCSWGNNELQWYKRENTTVNNGILTITAKKEAGGNNKQYTSSRIKSAYKVDIKYGRIEARMKMPVGQGIWPAFWMLPTDKVYGDWPKSGELDIMEFLGHEPNTVHGTLHFGNPWPNNSSTTGSFVSQGNGLNDGFHEYVLEWKENNIKWFIDGYLYSEKKSSDLLGLRWPFDQRFHFLLNLAVGGNWPGNPNGTTVFPQEYQIDYIRVYDLVDQAYITGLQKVTQGDAGVDYKIKNYPAGGSTTWSVPDGATIVSNTNEAIKVNFGASSGNVKAEVTSACGTKSFLIYVKAEGALAPAITLEDFDTPGKITRTSNTGVFTDNAPNPGKNSINESDLCGKYVRNSSEQYDVLVYTIKDITDASQFVKGDKKLYIDIYTSAPVGSTIILQFENSNAAKSTNYPTGRHSRYQTSTKKQNEWERIEVPFLDRPDAGVSNSLVNQLIVLLAPNSFTNHTYYIDNFQIYARGITNTFDEKLAKSVTLHPVPADEFLHISFDENSLKSLDVFDLSGKLVLHKNGINNAQYSLPLHDLPSGQYSIRLITTDLKMVAKSFIKQ